MIQQLDDPQREYFIIFTEGQHWSKRWLKPNFSHVYAVTRDKYNWLVINPTRRYLQVYIPACPIDEDYVEMLQSASPSNSVIKVTTHNRNPMTYFGHYGPLNCVTYIKYLLGLRSRSITPFGLYKTLLRFCTIRSKEHGIVDIQEISYVRNTRPQGG